MEFMIVQNRSFEGLVAAVALKLKVGWQLHGPVTPIAGRFGRTIAFYQALVREPQPA